MEGPYVTLGLGLFIATGVLLLIWGAWDIRPLL